MKKTALVFAILLAFSGLLSAHGVEVNDDPGPPADDGKYGDHDVDSDDGSGDGGGVGESGRVYFFFTENEIPCTYVGDEGYPIPARRTICDPSIFNNCDYDRVCAPI